MPNSYRDQPAEQQAAKWQAQLSSDLVTDQHKKEFALWLAERHENAIAWQKINAFWVNLDQVKAADLGIDLGIKDYAQVIPLSKWQVKSRITRYCIPALGLAASLVLALTFMFNSLDFYFADYTTAPGQQRQITLSDGSEILMNTDTAISVNFTQQQRQIQLVAGEAYFKVASDTRRPFVVATDMGQTQALGTAFDVKLQDNETAVTVFEHAVKITTHNGKVLDHLAAGQQAEFTDNTLSASSKTDLQRAMAWRKQRMVFQNRSLAEVAAELDRYRPGRIVIMGASIKNLRMTGVFGTENTDIALRTIELSLPVKVSKFTDKLVVLSAK